MYSKTTAQLEKFDNQHDFERMSADILNALGYKDVVLVAPRGGSDGGRDITFTTESGGKGLACVTLRKDSDKKFREDFSQRSENDFDKYFFFTNQYLTAGQKKDFIRSCLDQLDAELISQDIEAIRSLLDSSLKAIRSVYLDTEDDKIKELGVAKSVLYFLEDRRVLYRPEELENPKHCIASINEIRKFLTEKINDLNQNSELSQNLRIMRAACRKFLDSSEAFKSHSFSRHSYHHWIFCSSLGEMRGTFGMCLSQILFLYKLNIEERLLDSKESLGDILPTQDKE